ncbi:MULTISPECIES: pyridoxamine 5'-phosphate oxidase family protein [unclassified Neisseria]|uniref:pyridoxamine 5'-phosphate oxidase family protein n=1 Tax=unclassified Neisseria TaxID=2623750 RepID=UPI0010718C42|nr:MULTISPECIES: pyridoxamine 5'-phosphate oxidase family protein [unclassified Neisseria]MBF0804881.1 pyridoxamine 5'-phosphate oxidase family protein [Neisseria sp. 19428wB4_WF04]TFU39415.1 pyridoxamine 5'-phosphate oxidase family protein [Neisseria sp. WF04]
MPENIFKQVSLDILRLHQKAVHTLLATQCSGCPEIHDAVFVTLNGRYYVWLTESPQSDPKTGILLIEAEGTPTRLSWVARARRLKKKDRLYCRAAAALQRRINPDQAASCPADSPCLLELTPQQGRLTVNDNRDFTLMPSDLMKALYPAKQTIEAFAS